MTAEIDEDGVEIAGDGYDWGRDARELVPELRVEIERLRAENREHALSELAALGQAEEAYGAQLKAEAEIERLRADIERWQKAFSTQTRKLESVLDIPGVRSTLRGFIDKEAMG